MESNVVTERAKFVLEWQKRWEAARGGRVDVAELCRRFGISRQTGYVWIRRFVEAGRDVRALEDRSRRPKRSPTAVPQDMVDFLIAARRRHPTWGPRKLRAWLCDRHPSRTFPSATTIARIFERHGLSTKRRWRRRRRVPAATTPFSRATEPNAVWCIDFKGSITTGDGVRCGPLTVIDAFSRFCIRCELLDEGTSDQVMHVLDSAFREYGIPGAMRSDNGPPFASTGAGGLTRLAVWLLRLGIRLERIQPGKPQQNGRQERFHRTLEQEAATPPKATWRAQRRAFYRFRREYNEERPHEALGNKPPASTYVPSARRFPTQLLDFSNGFGHDCRVDRRGFIAFGRHRLFVSTALYGETVQVVPEDRGWTVYFGPVPLGRIDDRASRRLRLRSRPRKSNFLDVSGISWD